MWIICVKPLVDHCRFCPETHPKLINFHLFQTIITVGRELAEFSFLNFTLRSSLSPRFAPKISRAIIIIIIGVGVKFVSLPKPAITLYKLMIRS